MGDQLKLIEKAGFIDVKYLGETGINTSGFTIGGQFLATKPEKAGA